jgi:hypothetical protein
MNACDHPHGGGRGKSKGNKHPRSVYGWLTRGKRTRRPKDKDGNKMCVRSLLTSVNLAFELTYNRFFPTFPTFLLFLSFLSTGSSRNDRADELRDRNRGFHNIVSADAFVTISSVASRRIPYGGVIEDRSSSLAFR